MKIRKWEKQTKKLLVANDKKIHSFSCLFHSNTHFEDYSFLFAEKKTFWLLFCFHFLFAWFSYPNWTHEEEKSVLNVLNKTRASHIHILFFFNTHRKSPFPLHVIVLLLLLARWLSFFWFVISVFISLTRMSAGKSTALRRHRHCFAVYCLLFHICCCSAASVFCCYCLYFLIRFFV